MASSSPDLTFKKKKVKHALIVHRPAVWKRDLYRVESEIAQLEKRSPDADPTIKTKKMKKKSKFIAVYHSAIDGYRPELAKRSAEDFFDFEVETKVKREADPTFKKKKKFLKHSPANKFYLTLWKRSADEDFEDEKIVKRSPDAEPTLKAKKIFKKNFLKSLHPARRFYRSLDSEDELVKIVSKRSPTFKKSKKFKLFSPLWKRSVDEKTKRSADAEPTLFKKKKLFVSPPSYFPHYYYTNSFW